MTQFITGYGFDFETKKLNNYDKKFKNGKYHLPQLELFYILEHGHTPRKATAGLRAHKLQLVGIGEAHLILHPVEVTLINERLFTHYIGLVNLYQMLFVLFKFTVLILSIFLVLFVLLLLY